METIKVAENVTIKSIEANYISFSQTENEENIMDLNLQGYF